MDRISFSALKALFINLLNPFSKSILEIKRLDSTEVLEPLKLKSIPTDPGKPRTKITAPIIFPSYSERNVKN